MRAAFNLKTINIGIYSTETGKRPRTVAARSRPWVMTVRSLQSWAGIPFEAVSVFC
jgi:hypothetical protein